jgi:hypothetical protein
MKIDPSKHMYKCRVQKGCRVEWFEGKVKHKGVVKRVISAPSIYGIDPYQVVVETGDKTVYTVDVDKIRILKKETK